MPFLLLDFMKVFIDKLTDSDAVEQIARICSVTTMGMITQESRLIRNAYGFGHRIPGILGSCC